VEGQGSGAEAGDDRNDGGVSVVVGYTRIYSSAPPREVCALMHRSCCGLSGGCRFVSARLPPSARGGDSAGPWVTKLQARRCPCFAGTFTSHREPALIRRWTSSRCDLTMSSGMPPLALAAAVSQQEQRSATRHRHL
jgi:hypothetical protein